MIKKLMFSRYLEFCAIYFLINAKIINIIK